MNVASLELCQELYGLSGWDATEFYYWVLNKGPEDNFQEYEVVQHGSNEPAEWLIKFNAYDLGYLLRELPNMVTDNTDGETVVTDNTSSGTPFGLTHCEDGTWFADYSGYVYGQAATPEDAVAKLAIELFKQGILTCALQGEKGK